MRRLLATLAGVVCIVLLSAAAVSARDATDPSGLSGSRFVVTFVPPLTDVQDSSCGGTSYASHGLEVRNLAKHPHAGITGNWGRINVSGTRYELGILTLSSTPIPLNPRWATDIIITPSSSISSGCPKPGTGDNRNPKFVVFWGAERRSDSARVAGCGVVQLHVGSPLRLTATVTLGAGKFIGQDSASACN